MKANDFEEVLQGRLSKIDKVLGTKADEYAVLGNRMHNFDVAAIFGGITPESALWGMAMKHLVSVTDLVKFPKDATPEFVDEKIGDMINYLILLEGLLVRRMKIKQYPAPVPPEVDHGGM